MTLKPHEIRVCNERDELAEKVAALSVFIDGDIFEKEVSDGNKILLRAQLRVMNNYLRILDQRIGLMVAEPGT